MKTIYEIGGHALVIEYDDDAIMAALPEFSVFQTDYPFPIEKTILLEKIVPRMSDGHLYYTMRTENTVCKLYELADANDMEIWQEGVLKLSLHTEWNKPECSIQGIFSPILLRFALWVAYNWLVGKHQTVAIHSSAIVCKEKAFLYIGESGTGKSTHTRLIHQRRPDVELLNDDSPILRIEGGKCMVYGSPWSGKTSCYKQKKVELGSVVRLKQASCNHIIQLEVIQALSVFLPSLPPELYLSARYEHYMMNISANVLESSNVFLLECLPNQEAANLSVKVVIEGL